MDVKEYLTQLLGIKETVFSGKGAMLALFTLVIIVSRIFIGSFTATESAVVAAVYA